MLDLDATLASTGDYSPASEFPVSRLNVYVDGPWLFKVCAPGGVLAAHMEYENQAVPLDFTRLDMILLDHAMAHDPDCTELGERYLCMSIFTLPPDFDTWPTRHSGVQYEHIERTKRLIFARSRFIKSATDAGYTHYNPGRQMLEPWILRLLVDDQKTYHEKEVDGTIIALLVEAATEVPADQHCVITGDADFLAAARATKNGSNRNVILATTRPDKTKAEHRQSSNRLNNFPFRIRPVYLEDDLMEIVKGRYVYECSRCQFVCPRDDSPPRHSPCCHACYRTKSSNRYPNAARCV